MALKPDGLCVYETTIKQTAYNFSESLILIPFFMILNFLNKMKAKLFASKNLKSFYCKLKVYR